MDNAKILRNVEHMEHLAYALLEQATVVRRELEGGFFNSPKRGKSKKNQEAINTVLRNRAIQTGRKLNK